MDILRFVNSKDIREHLRNIGYEFNSKLSFADGGRR